MKAAQGHSLSAVPLAREALWGRDEKQENRGGGSSDTPRPLVSERSKETYTWWRDGDVR
jgi:hypothetical protein